MDPILAGILAGLFALAALAVIGLWIAGAVMLLRFLRSIINDLKGD